MSWSPQQEDAIKRVRHWLRQPVGRSRSDQLFRIFGYAGTGKTTLAKSLASDVRGGAVFGAFTGKAALVLRKKGCEDASTIHSLIYRVDEDDETSHGGSPTFVLNEFSDVKTAGLVIIDECSMVDEPLGLDLLSFGTKVLVLGDPAQLPPVNGAGFFTNGEPDVMLTEVHRQAAENPIIRMSMDVRNGGRLKVGRYGESRVITRAELDPEDVLSADQVLVGMNKTRRQFNGRIRALKHLDPEGPQAGDRLICLKNDRKKQLLNGGLWTVERLEKTRTRKRDAEQPADGMWAGASNRVTMRVNSDDEEGAKPRVVTVLRGFFDPKQDEAQITRQDKKGTDEFTYGYAITCHKSQGSQWDNVMLFDESGIFREEAKRWLYTGLTRAAETITVVV